jgi:hypothetical protein
MSPTPSTPAIIHRVPVELWHQILRFATEVEDGDEFGLLQSSKLSLEYGENIFNCIVPAREQQRAFRTRLSTVLVCRGWHAIATRFLWSHLILDQEMWMQLVVPEPESEVWSFVKRLDVYPILNGDAGVTNQTSGLEFKECLFTRIYPHLRNLRILSAPHSLAMGEYNCCLDIVTLHPSGFISLLLGDIDEGDNENAWDGEPHFWRHARRLDLDLDFTQLSSNARNSPNKDILFPRMVHLGIHSPHCEALVAHITAHWKIPKLQVLSIRSGYAQNCASLLTWSSRTLHTLELSAIALKPTIPVLLPSLTSIIVENCFFQGWDRVIEAPLLLKLSFCDSMANTMFEHNRGRFARILGQISSRYSTCCSITFFRFKELIFTFNPTDSLERAKANRNGWLE